MAKLTTQAGGVSIGRGVAAVAQLATVMILSRLLTQEDYGTYRQVWLLFFTLAPVLDLGISQAVPYFTPQLRPEEQKTYFTQSGLALLASGSLLGGGLYLLAPAIADLFSNPDLVLPLRAFSLFPVFALPFNMSEHAMVALGMAGKAGILTGAAALLQAAVILAAFGLGASTSHAFIVLSAWTALRTVGLAGLLLLSSRNQAFHWDLRSLLRQLSFALPLGAAAMVSLLGRQMDKIIVSSTVGPERYAVYANGSYDIPLISILTMSVMSVLIPAIVRAQAQGNMEEIRRMWHGAARRVATVFFPVFVFLFIAAEPFIVFLFSADYTESAQPFRVFLFLLPLRIAFYSGFLRALGRTGPIFITSAGGLVITSILAVVLVRFDWLGILGPAIAVVVSSIWAAFYAISVAIRTLRWSWRTYFPWSALASIMGIAILASLPSLFVGAFTSDLPPLPQLATMGIVYALAYAALGEWTGAARLREWGHAVMDVVRQR